ncbi:MAG: SMP-30/gluconolactonase/LRE family protein [Fimbriimonadia bacterium]|nr:SMP-30/gluconolactonase/LRE family protein [Fimbriimonadia bacterium]
MEFIKIADGFQFPEGPAYDAKQNALFIVNVQSNRLDRLILDGMKPAKKELYAELPGKGNGATFHRDGTLYIADYERRAILKVTAPNKVDVVVDKFEGQPFRGPNDLCFDKAGNLYFTDPRDTWNEPIGSVYCLRKDGKLERFGSGLHFPNGIALDPEEKHVYVAETRRNHIIRYALQQGKISEKSEVFATLPQPAIGPDGMRFDKEGNLWIAQFGANVVVVDNSGKVAQQHALPGKNLTNLEFGGKDGKTLFVTETQTNAVYAAVVPTSRN